MNSGRKIFLGQVRSERLGAESGEVGQGFDLAPGAQKDFRKFPEVRQPEHPAIIKEEDEVNVLVDRLGKWPREDAYRHRSPTVPSKTPLPDQKMAGHLLVNEQKTASVQVNKDVLASTLDPLKTRPFEKTREQSVGRLFYKLRSIGPDLLDAPSQDFSAQVSDHGFDFGQLGHDAQITSKATSAVGTSVGSIGIVKKKVVPRFTSDSAHIWPPWAWTMFLAI